MYTFLTIYSIVVLVLLVFKIKWGLILYILMIFLLPSLSFTIGGIALKWNFFLSSTYKCNFLGADNKQ